MFAGWTWADLFIDASTVVRSPPATLQQLTVDTIRRPKLHVR